MVTSNRTNKGLRQQFDWHNPKKYWAYGFLD